MRKVVISILLINTLFMFFSSHEVTTYTSKPVCETLECIEAI